jgi:ABC-type uncharacterized transport system permease subunit
MLNLHPKIKAALAAYIGIVAVAVAGWLQGTLSQSEMISALIAGAVTVVTGYLKSDTSTADPDPVGPVE